jgi:hypothetical protein
VLKIAKTAVKGSPHRWRVKCVKLSYASTQTLHTYICTHTYDRIYRCRDSSVGVATAYGLDDRVFGVRVSIGSTIFSSPCRPYRFWGPPRLLYIGYRGLFPRGKSGRGVKLTTHLQLVSRSRKRGYIHSLPHMPSWPSA